MALNTAKNFLIGISVILVLLSLFFIFNRTEGLKEDNDRLHDSIIRLNERADLYVKAYYDILKKDSVLNQRYDSLNKERQKIKTRYVERIKVIDRYSVSDMQRYFDERTAKGSDTRQYTGK